MHLLVRGPVEAGDVFFGNQRIAERVVLVVVFDQRVRQGFALLDAEALADRASRDIAQHHFQGDDLDLPDQLLAHVEAADEVGRDADMGEAGEDVFADAIVDRALAVDCALFLRVEGRRIVLEILDQRARFGTLIEDLGFAFVNLGAAGHHVGTPSSAANLWHMVPGGGIEPPTRGSSIRCSTPELPGHPMQAPGKSHLTAPASK